MNNVISITTPKPCHSCRELTERWQGYCATCIQAEALDGVEVSVLAILNLLKMQRHRRSGDLSEDIRTELSRALRSSAAAVAMVDEVAAETHIRATRS
jgi:predicted ATP-dependent serine protease